MLLYGITYMIFTSHINAARLMLLMKKVIKSVSHHSGPLQLKANTYESVAHISSW